MYKSFIFNLDGTIIDAESIGLTTLQSILKAKGIDKNLNDLRFSLQIPGLCTAEVLEMADLPTTLDSRAVREPSLQGHVPIFPEVLDIMVQLPCTAFLTSQTLKELNNGFYQLGIHRHFEAIVSADDTTKYKPNPDPLQYGLHLLNCPPEQAIYIGDSREDMRCAHTAGVDFGLAVWGAKCHSAFKHVDYTFERPGDILKLIKT